LILDTPSRFNQPNSGPAKPFVQRTAHANLQTGAGIAAVLSGKAI
jgi:hypothetical protein